MSVIKLASRYAKSLIDLSIEKGQLELVYADIKLLKEVIKVSREFQLMLKSPIISADKKEKVIDAILLGKISEITIAFKKILVRKGREAYLEDIADAFITQYNKHKNITPIKIKSVIELSDEMVNKLLDKVKQAAHLETVELTTEVDEELIGGFVLQFEDKLYDASVLRKLERIKVDFKDDAYIKKLFK